MENLPYDEFIEEFTKTFDDAIAKNEAKIKEISEWKKDLLENRFPIINNTLQEIEDANVRLDEMHEMKSRELEELQKDEKKSKEKADKTKKILDDLYKDRYALKHEHNKMKKQCEKLVGKKSEQDEFKNFLDELKSKLEVYVKLTNVKWDFEVDDNVVRGYVNNKFLNKIKAFSYNLNERTQDEIVERIWADIYSVHEDCEKENMPSN